MYNCQRNTCVGNKKGNQACVPAGKTHAQETKKEIRHVCRQGKHMRRKRKKKLGMCAGRENTCVGNKKRKLGMCASRENTCVETKKRNQVCKEQK